ncbi:MAG: hypothetical protein LBV54_06230, partial [Puniceicoccales bacterium]|nr:hypothetical protein [Puniceicoccales bacterium]
MKIRLSFPLVALFAFLAILMPAFAADPAVQEHEPVRAQAERDLDDWLVNAVRKAEDTGNFLGDHNAEVARAKALSLFLDKAPPVCRSLIALAIAEEYKSQLYRNSTELAARPAAKVVEADIHTWNTARFHAEIKRLHALALADTAALQRTPVSTFSSYFSSIARASSSHPKFNDALRPTLYDYVAHEIIISSNSHFRSYWRYNPVSPVLPTDTPLLVPLEEFLAWQPKAADADSETLYAIRLFQDVLRFHQNDATPDALADADLNRLLYGNRLIGDSPEAKVRTEAALRTFIKRWENCAVASDAYAELALLLGNHKNPESTRIAIELARTGAALHPDSPGGKRCHAIVVRLEAPELISLNSEKIWNAPFPELEITYRRATKLYIRVVPANFEEEPDDEKTSFSRFGYLRHETVSELLKKTPAKTWQVPLPASDYGPRVYRFSPPEDLSPGYYCILVSVDQNFTYETKSTKDAPLNTLFTHFVWVSNIALLAEPRGRDFVRGFVLNAITGDPVPGATVTGRYDSFEGNKTVHVKTDASGAYILEKSNHLLIARSPDGHQVATDMQMRINYRRVRGGWKRFNNGLNMHFFTDRAIYRPGQTIHFKGIVFTSNHNTGKFQTVGAGETITVKLSGSAAIATLQLITNEHGSIHGTFTLPSGGWTGSYELRGSGKIGGEDFRTEHSVEVEEYKRPKFEVALNPPQISLRPEVPVTLTGVATAYNGEPVIGAQVRYKVKYGNGHKGVRMPECKGTATTNATGAFFITFPTHAEQVHYAVSVEITDATGETRDATLTLEIPPVALTAQLSVEEWQTIEHPVTLKISTALPIGTPQKASGKLTLHALKQPEKTLRPRLPLERDPDEDRGFDYSGYPFHAAKRVPSETDPADPANWPTAEAILSQDIETDANGSATLTTATALPAGIYRAVFATHDAFGEPLSATAQIIVHDLRSEKTAVRLPFIFAVEKSELRVGETFRALWDSGCDTARAFVSIERRGKVIQSFWTAAGHTRQQITLPITESLRGGFLVNILQVRDNRLYSESRTIEVPFFDGNISFAWERFNSRLVPGGQEKWALRIRGENPGFPVEFAAALYDASLDALVKNWKPKFGDALGTLEHRDGFIWENLSSLFSIENWCFPTGLYFTNHKDRIVKKYDSLETFIHRGYRSSDIHFSDEKESYRGGQPPWSFSHWSRLFSDPESRNRVYLSGRMISPPELTNQRKNPLRNRAEPAAAAALDPSVDTIREPATPPSTDVAGDLNAVSARRNLQETVFFFPALLADADGSVRI